MPSLSLTATSASGLDFSWTGIPAGNRSTFELNRAEDFASDDSLFIYGVGGASKPIRGLPSGTPWFVRMRDEAGGEWSNVVLAATDRVGTILPYTGFSIDKAVLVVPEACRLTAPSPGTFPSPGNPAGNLRRDDPASTFQFMGGNAVIYADTAGVAIDSFALLGSLCGAGWLVQLFAFPTPADRDARTNAIYAVQEDFACSPGRDRPALVHHFRLLPAVITARYWMVAILSPADGTSFICRNLVFGLARSSVNASRGAGAAAADQGTFSRNRFGTPDRVRGWRGRSVDFELSWLNEREYQTKWSDLPSRVGRTDSVLAIPNSKRNAYLNDRIAFGPITTMRGENVQSFKFSQSIEIDSIY